jgi:dipeptidyl aminopeptidase/acylaminoacyl peptidase
MGGLLDLIAAVRADYPKVDPARIYCTGFSMGGFASAQLAAFHGELFAAVSCQGGAGRPEWAEQIKIPVQVVQGGADPIVKPEFTAKTVDAMKAAGVNPEVHVIPFANHEYLAGQYMGLAMDYFDKHAK